MNILIIGSKGFIGSHALKYFSTQTDTECWGCDVMVDYVSKNYFLIDSTNSDFNEIFETIKFDVCINCSGAASVPDSLTHPFRDFSLNTLNVFKILEAIRKIAKECRFINLSSAAVYGNPIALPLKETEDLKPVSPYGIHKLFSEQICKEYFDHFNIKSCSIRVFSAYGPGLKKQLLWDIFKKTLNSQSINLFGNGSETRDFIYIEDILRAINIIMVNGEFISESYNLASGTETSINDLASSLLSALSYQGSILYSGVNRLGDPLKWCANITKITKMGFNPTVSITQGTQKYVEWLKEEKLL